MSKKNLQFATKAIHASRDPQKNHGCVNNGIFQTSTLVFKTYEDFLFADKIYYNKAEYNPRERTYGRNGTETIFDCEEAIASLYNTDYAKLTSSGLSAIFTSLNAFCYNGAHILVADGVYGPTRSLSEKTFKKYGVDVTFFSPTINENDMEKLIKPNTCLIFLESPSSLTFEMHDISSITKVAKKHKIPTILDNTFFTAHYFKPFDFGIDIVVESCTKFMSGHSDIMAGAIVFNKEFSSKIFASTREVGANTTGMNAYYLLRGLRTMKTRLDAHRQSVDHVINFLKQYDVIKEIRHPSQKTTPGYEFFAKHYTGYTSLFSVIFKKKYPENIMSKFFNRLEHFGIGYSWGGYESLIIQFPDDLHKIRSHSTISDVTCVRFYIGLEDVKDLTEDLAESFKLLD